MRDLPSPRFVLGGLRACTITSLLVAGCAMGDQGIGGSGFAGASSGVRAASATTGLQVGAGQTSTTVTATAQAATAQAATAQAATAQAATAATQVASQSASAGGGIEICNNGDDDNNDGFLDCEDAQCVATLPCTDPCAAAIPLLVPIVSVPFFTTGGADVLESTCGGFGYDVVYQVTASTSGFLAVNIQPQNEGGIVSVRTSCTDVGSELGCSAGGGSAWQQISVPVVQGATYFILVEGGNDDWVSTSANIFGPEEQCQNGLDDNNDDFPDCQDPSCQPTPACSPGAKLYGAECEEHNECFSSSRDPICLSGVCSEFCSESDICAGDLACVPVGNLVKYGGICEEP